MGFIVYAGVIGALVVAAIGYLWWRDHGRGFEGGPLSDRAIENARRQAGSGHGAADQARLRRGGGGAGPL